MKRDSVLVPDADAQEQVRFIASAIAADMARYAAEWVERNVRQCRRCGRVWLYGVGQRRYCPKCSVPRRKRSKKEGSE